MICVNNLLYIFCTNGFFIVILQAEKKQQHLSFISVNKKTWILY